MTDQTAPDEKKVHDEVQKIISGLLKFDKESRIRIYETVGTFFRYDAAPVQRPLVTMNSQSPYLRDSSVSSFSERDELPPKEFLFQKQPNTDVERVACLAFYLKNYRDTLHFKTIDISKLNTEAAQVKFSNAAYAMSNATRAGLLAAAGNKDSKQLSAIGERYVDALPDRSEAREVRSNVRRRSRKKTANKARPTK